MIDEIVSVPASSLYWRDYLNTVPGRPITEAMKAKLIWIREGIVLEAKAHRKDVTEHQEYEVFVLAGLYLQQVNERLYY
jgi:hypothetical protein